MELPLEFLKKYERLLDTDFPAFLASFDESAISAYRVNPLKDLDKWQAQNQDKAISGSSYGFYGKVSGKSPEHVMGLVYSQEPAAQMVVGALAGIKPGMKVLDLCAAPGGKSTQILSHLQGQGLLVSNEISGKRSKVLVENIERFSARNVVVLNEETGHLAEVFPTYFDVIVLDAPCSGEGMFRKDPEAMQYWSADYPSQCATLQREIISQALKMLAPGGRLIYSTCTWAPEENEDNVRWMLENFSDLSLVNLPKENGLAAGFDMPEVVRCWPHLFAGEGQFIACLQDTRLPVANEVEVKKAKKKSRKKAENVRSNLNAEQKNLWLDFAEKHLKVDFEVQNMQAFGDNLYLLPAGLPDLSGFRIARNGLHLGVFKKKRFEPSFALGLALRPFVETRAVLEIDHEQFFQVVAGQAFQADFQGENQVRKGWVQLAFEGNGLGFAKVVDGTVKNFFPKGLRFSK